MHVDSNAGWSFHIDDFCAQLCAGALSSVSYGSHNEHTVLGNVTTITAQDHLAEGSYKINERH